MMYFSSTCERPAKNRILLIREHLDFFFKLLYLVQLLLNECGPNAKTV